MLLSDDVCHGVCLSRTSGLNREQRPRKTKIGTEIAHVARDSNTTFKVKGQGHQAALLTAALTREAGVAVTVRTYWAWPRGNYCYVASARRCARCWGAHRGEKRGGAYRVATRTACSDVNGRYTLWPTSKDSAMWTPQIAIHMWMSFDDTIYETAEQCVVGNTSVVGKVTS